LNFHSDSSLKQQSVSRHIASLTHYPDSEPILQSWFDLTRAWIHDIQ